MKFQCDRCKTRYSIADERVRGKILKIRCKNCEAVITVREGMEVGPEEAPAAAAKRPAPAAPKQPQPKQTSKPVLRGAFEKAMEKGPPRPPAPTPFDDDATAIADPPPPQQLQEEWYVSKDGDQFGPFELSEAQRWVAQRNPREELFCWTEGFDDWQSVDKVSHFRRSRRASTNPPPPPRASGAPAVPAAQRSDTPQPLFAATMAAIEAEESGPVKGRDGDEPSGPTNGASAQGGGDNDFDFDIGEASRVVNLSMLAPPTARRSGQQPAAALPGMGGGDASLGRGTGNYAHVQEVDPQGRQTGRGAVVVPLSDEALASARPDVLQGPAARGRSGVQLWHVLAGVGGIAGLAVIMLVIALSGDDSNDPSRVVRSRIDGEGLGYRLDPRERKAAEEAREAQARGGDRGRGSRRVASQGKTTRTAPRAINPFVKTDDFDFGDQDEGNQPLTPDDVMKVYQDRKLGVKLCYERALKKDPLLDVKKVYVNLSVAPSGVVTNVSMSSHGSTQLGQCLVAQIRRWKFRKSPETFTGRFPLVFRN